MKWSEIQSLIQTSMSTVKLNLRPNIVMCMGQRMLSKVGNGLLMKGFLKAVLVVLDQEVMQLLQMIQTTRKVKLY